MSLDNEIANLRLDIEEMKGFLDESKRHRVQDILSIETRRLETKLVDLLKKQEEASKPVPVQTNAPVASINKAYDVIVKTYSWEESDKFVKIYLTDMQNVQSKTDLANDFEFKVDLKSVHFVAKNLNGKNYVFDIQELADKITPEKCEFKVKSDMVVLLLKKYETKSWNHLKMVEKQTAEKKMKPPAKDEDPNASLMNLMKQMYDDGDDDMKRTIAKAWTESRSVGGP